MFSTLWWTQAYAALYVLVGLVGLLFYSTYSTQRVYCTYALACVQGGLVGGTPSSVATCCPLSIV